MNSKAWRAAEAASIDVLGMTLVHTISLLEISKDRIAPKVLLDMIEFKIRELNYAVTLARQSGLWPNDFKPDFTTAASAETGAEAHETREAVRP